jgi:hypothetical protein
MNSCDAMTAEQIAKLAQAICATAEILGQQVSPEAADLMAEDLSSYPAAIVAGALKACRRELTGRLTLAAILERVQRADGHPAPDEAWAIALSASDEARTVVMTQEIQQALCVASPVLDAGDKIGGRRTFLSAYERILAESRAASKPATWIASLGHDPQQRIAAIEEAGRMGRLSWHEVERIAGPVRLQLAPPSRDGLAIAGLLTGKPVDSARNAGRITELKAAIRKGAADRKAKRDADRAAALADLEARKRAAAEAVARHQCTRE